MIRWIKDENDTLQPKEAKENDMKNLIAFVQEKHSKQVRKYTVEPYFVHLEAVASLVATHLEDKRLVAIAYSHDLLEDTDCTEEDSNALALDSFSNSDIGYILEGVNALTDVFTHEAYPDLNRAERKWKESERLSAIRPEFQSVKYCDIMHNSISILEYDREGFGVTYVREMSNVLSTMNKGDPGAA